MKKQKAFAPATCGNVCVGYDVLGLCYTGVGDTVTVEQIPEQIVRIDKIKSLDPLPTRAADNSAGVVLEKLIREYDLEHGFAIEIEKGIATKSGMGGSAASAVGALVAANALLKNPLSKETLLSYALYGEEVACGSAHIDNVAPCLYGGLTFQNSNGSIENVPFPNSIQILLIHPHLKVETRKAREVLKEGFSPEKVQQQKLYLESFLKGCRENDLELISSSFVDLLTEEKRAPLTQGFQEAKKIALNAGALGYSLSGSGPSQICLCRSSRECKIISEKIQKHYESLSIQSDHFIGPINQEGSILI